LIAPWGRDGPQLRSLINTQPDTRVAIPNVSNAVGRPTRQAMPTTPLVQSMKDSPLCGFNAVPDRSRLCRQSHQL
jgi:hypothetical protein